MDDVSSWYTEHHRFLWNKGSSSVYIIKRHLLLVSLNQAQSHLHHGDQRYFFRLRTTRIERDSSGSVEVYLAYFRSTSGHEHGMVLEEVLKTNILLREFAKYYHTFDRIFIINGIWWLCTHGNRSSSARKHCIRFVCHWEKNNEDIWWPSTDIGDRDGWRFTNNGKYTVKSGY